MTKKISALFVLSVFLLSLIPLAFAEDDEGIVVALGEGQSTIITGFATTDTDSAEDEPEEDAADVRPRARQVKREAVEEKVQMVKKKVARVKERIRISDKSLLEKRKLVRAELVKAKDHYKLAKKHFLDIKKAYLGQKVKFVHAKKAYKECKDVDSEECNEKRAQIKSAAKPYLLHVADLILKELERVKAKVEASEDLSQEEIDRIVADLEDKIQEVEAAKAVIENIDEDSSKDEINEAAKTIKNTWRKTKVALKKHTGKLVNARLGNIILRTETLEKKLYRTRDRLEGEGLDVSALDNSLEEFSAKLDEAADLYTEARELWSDANTPDEVDQVAKEVHELLVNAKAALKDARDLLRTVVKEIKSLNKGSIDVVSDEEAEEAEEQEEAEDEEQEE